METKTTVALFVIAIAAFGLIAASIILDSHDASAKKSCASVKYSHCKGTKGYYTTNGHHHCFENVDKNCKKSTKIR